MAKDNNLFFIGPTAEVWYIAFFFIKITTSAGQNPSANNCWIHFRLEAMLPWSTPFSISVNKFQAWNLLALKSTFENIVKTHPGVIPCQTTEKKLDVPKMASNFLDHLNTPNKEGQNIVLAKNYF